MMMINQLQFPPKQFIREPPLIDVSHTMWRYPNVLQGNQSPPSFSDFRAQSLGFIFS